MNFRPKPPVPRFLRGFLRFAPLLLCGFGTPLAHAASYTLLPSSRVTLSGTFNGQPWRPQDPGGLSLQAPLSGMIEGSWDGHRFEVGQIDLAVGLGLAGIGFPTPDMVAGGTLGVFNFAGWVDAGGIDIGSSTYDFGLRILAGNLYTDTFGDSLTAQSTSGTSLFAYRGTPAAYPTSLAGGQALAVNAEAVTRGAGPDGETLEVPITVIFQGTTLLGQNLVPFSLEYSNQLVASTVPEPSAALLCSASCLLLFRRRRKG